MTKIRIADIEEELSKLTPFEGRTAETTDEETADTFAALAPFDTGGVFTGSFSGESPWERHTAGDEFVHILEGAAKLTIELEDGPEVLALEAGMITVVPKGLWHRFQAPDGVTLLTVTPHPTDHSSRSNPGD